MNKLITLFVTFGGVGFLPKMPGTWGTLAALPLLWALWQFSLPVYIGVTVLLTFISIPLVSAYETNTKKHDPKEVVIDEVIGLLVAGFMLNISATNLLSAFVLFRWFDIWKPFPIGYIDKNLPGAWGTVLDDVMAGVLACLVCHLSLSIT